MATRGDKFLHALDARYRYANQLQRIDRDIADEQQRFQAAQSYASQARSELNALDSQLSQVTDQTSVATELLSMVNRDELAASAALAGARTARRVAQQTPTWAAAFFDPQAAPGTAFVALQQIAREDKGDRRMTAAQVDAVARDAKALGATDDQIARFRESLPKGARPDVPTGEAKLTEQQRRDVELTERAAAALKFGGPAGIVGGFDGEAEADRRRAAALPEGSLFATEEDALKSYLSLLDDGRVTLDELRDTYPDATDDELQKGLRIAQATYNRAKAAKAYRNDERKFFSERYLDQARKVRELEDRAQQLLPQYTDPARERLRRIAVERGIDPDDPYVQYKGTPMYRYAQTADRLLGEVAGEELRAATREQVAVKRLLDQYAATGTDWKVKDLEQQLGKTIKGEALEQAIGFALAVDKQTREGVDAPTQLQLQTQRAAQEAKADRALERIAAREQSRLDFAREEKERAAADAAREAELDAVRAEEQEAIAAQAQRAYQTARMSGASPDEARAAMMEVYQAAPRVAVAERAALQQEVAAETEATQAAAERRAREARIGISRALGEEADLELFGEAPAPAAAPEPPPATAPRTPRRRRIPPPETTEAAPVAGVAQMGMPDVSQQIPARRKSVKDMTDEELDAVMARELQ